jgi:hypothetical protein
MIFLLNNGTEIFLQYKTNMKLVDWLCSKLYVNDPKYFCLGLTLCGFSVTMQKKVKNEKTNNIQNT